MVARASMYGIRRMWAPIKQSRECEFAAGKPALPGEVSSSLFFSRGNEQSAILHGGLIVSLCKSIQELQLKCSLMWYN